MSSCVGLAHAVGLACVLLALGCGPSRAARFEDSDLLVGMGGTYKLDLRNEGAASEYTVVVRGDAVTASLATEDGFFEPRVIVWVETVAEGVSVVELRRGRRVIDSLSVEVAAVAEVHSELMLNLEDALFQEPFAVFVGEGVVLRLVGLDARGRTFDRFYREIAAVDPGITVTQLWRNLYAVDARTAGDFMVTAEVVGRRFDTVFHVVEPQDITAIRAEILDGRTALVVGTDSWGRAVQLLDGRLEADSIELFMYQAGLYSLPELTPPGTVLTASWSGLSTTYTF